MIEEIYMNSQNAFCKSLAVKCHSPKEYLIYVRNSDFFFYYYFLILILYFLLVFRPTLAKTKSATNNLTF